MSLFLGPSCARKSVTSYDERQRHTVEASSRALHLQPHRQQVKTQNSGLPPCAQISIVARCSPRRTSGGSRTGHEYQIVLWGVVDDVRCPTNQRGANLDQQVTNGRE